MVMPGGFQDIRGPSTGRLGSKPRAPLQNNGYRGTRHRQKTVKKVLEGGQTWDLNPLIYYRFRGGAVKDLSKLPEIILGDQIYNQDMQHNRQIFIVVRKKNVSIEELNEALSHCKSETKALLTRIENFTDEEDKEVLHILEQQLKARFPDSQDFVLKSDSQINKKEPIDDEES